MKLRAWMSVVIFWVGIGGCGDSSKGPIPQQPGEVSRDNMEVLPVKGFGQFGSQCPSEGSFVPPQAVPLELYQCPLRLSSVELMENLPAIILQADCKKRILDIRGRDRATATSWEFMPNGTFDITINGGFAKFKDDGVGTKNCAVPMVANLVGHVDCADRDHAKIYLDTAWYLDQVITNPMPTSNPSSVPSGVPIVLSSSLPSAALPGRTVSPAPSHSPSVPVVLPSSSPHPQVVPTDIPLPNHMQKCKLPPSCYLFNEVRIDQCT
jgi:hypothetical protein